MLAYVFSIVALPGGSSAESGVPLAARRPATRASGAACGKGGGRVCGTTGKRGANDEMG